MHTLTSSDSTIKYKEKTEFLMFRNHYFRCVPLSKTQQRRPVNIDNVPKPIVFSYINKIPTSCHCSCTKNEIGLTQPVKHISCQKDKKEWICIFSYLLLWFYLWKPGYKYTFINSSTCITYPLPGLVWKRILHNNDTFAPLKMN